MQKKERKSLKENSNDKCYNKKQIKERKKHRASLRDDNFKNSIDIASLLSQGLML